MGLPRTFVGFSSTDIHRYRLMQAWKANTNIGFNFTDCQFLYRVGPSKHLDMIIKWRKNGSDFWLRTLFLP
jgi:hypothetical protein